MKSLLWLKENGLLSWLIWFLGMFVLIAGLAAMMLLDATYLEYPLTILMTPLFIFYLYQVISRHQEE